MTRAKKPNPPRPYAVGSGKPPGHPRFQKGVSGTPRGRPRGIAPSTARGLALKEAYRLVTVRDGERVMRLPMIQAVLRSQLALAAKGHSPAQRAVIAVVDALEQEAALEAAAAREKAAAARPISSLEYGRRANVAMILGWRKLGRPMPENYHDAMLELLKHPSEIAQATETTKDGGT